MIKRWRERIKERREARLAAIEAEMDNARREAVALLQAESVKMLSAPCPFNGDTCSKSCVHFRDGRTYIIGYSHDAGRGYGATPPRCRLWMERT